MRDESIARGALPCPRHATPRHVFFAHLGTSSLQGSKTAAAGGRGRDGLTG